MIKPLAALAALLIASPLVAQSTATAPQYATPLPGSWTYSPTESGSEATFASTSGLPQLTIRCDRTIRRVTIAKPATAAAPFMVVWTSSNSLSIPASFDPLTNRISASLPAYDGLLDAMSFSRGRIAVTVSGTPMLVVPAWPEVARVVEDCRA
jgi:hypothetical protein